MKSLNAALVRYVLRAMKETPPMSKPVKMLLSEKDAQKAAEAFRGRIDKRHTWPPMSDDDRRKAMQEVDGLDVEAKRIVECVERWFLLSPTPEFNPHDGDLDYKDLRSFVEGVSWDEVDGLRLVSWSDYLHVMDDGMFAYYLPTYLRTFLTFWPRALEMAYFDRVMDYLNLTYEGTVFHRMTREQRECTLAFLRLFAKLATLF